MSDLDDPNGSKPQPNVISRRDLIKGVIVGGAAVSSSAYLFRASTLLAQTAGAAGERLLTLNVNGQQRRVDVMKQETLSWTLRHKLGLTGTRAARDGQMGWAVLNRVPSYISELRRGATAPVFTISSNHVEIGHIQGRQFEALLPDGGWILYVEGPSHSSSAQQRTSGMLETKPANVHFRTLKGQWTQESARRAVRSWLNLATSQRADFKLVAAQDDSMAIGARKAFEEIPDIPSRIAWLSLPFTGCDGVPKAGQTWVRNGLLAATIHIPPLAGLAIGMLANGIQNGIQAPETSTTIPASIPTLVELAARKR